jgi:hypothetical protein
VTPRVGVAALHARLDAAHGARGWSISYTPMPGEAVACHLVIDGVTKGVVAGPALVGGAEATAAIAFARAASLFGAAPAWPADASAWVACDPETHEPLHAPARPGQVGSPVAAPERPAEGAHRSRAPEGTADAGPRPDAGAPASADAPVISGVAPGEDTFAEAPAKPEGQQMIDRLIERLKAQGQGLVAARILVKHGGYGKDPVAARELYAALRQLLLAGGPADGRPSADARPSVDEPPPGGAA